MGRYIVRRFLWMLLVLFFVSLITFSLQHAVPGGPFDREKRLPPEIIANLENKYRLNDPLPKQYVDYMADILIPRITTKNEVPSLLTDAMIKIDIGDVRLKWMNWGPSYASRSRTVNDIFKAQLPVSAQLGLLAMLVALLIGIPMGILAALRQNTVLDYLGMSVAIFGVSVPVIVLGPILIWIFAVTLGWFPATGWGTAKQAVMPAVALGLASSALIARLTRASLLQVIREDYIRTARAKGLAERMVIIGHALKNSMIPVVTILGPMFAALTTGTFITEQIFGIPGMGKHFITSIGNRDYPVIMGTTLLYSIFLVAANLVVDITYAWLDPRIRYS
ncbi:MAG: ABC transporter permease [Chloroflexi bacterium]|nr:ABC transporter permease [Chloroflexota bacterium]